MAALLIPAGGGSYPPTMSRDDLMDRARPAVGYSYWWGGSCWCPAGRSCNHGSCHGNCPSCSHHGPYGADCSGFVNKVWQVPDPISLTHCYHGPYVAASYRSSTSYWHRISRGSLERGDAVASSHHVVLYERGNGWGNMWMYEARGCSYGIRHNARGLDSSYSAARRINISDCECTPGATQTDECGWCGHRTRRCNSSCRWGDWGRCEGQGECEAAKQQHRDCCDCGSQHRTCSSHCRWGGWSACAGPDPGGGNIVCDTGELGPCAEGRVRCIAGCRTCKRVYDPAPEKCDDFDNDCTGVADDGSPTEMGDPPPRYAALLIDWSHPASMEGGGVGSAWAKFENVGRETWRAGEVWLASASALAGTPSRLYDPARWSSWDVATKLERDVAPGEQGVLVFAVSAPDGPPGRIEESFVLVGPGGAPIRCPASEIEVAFDVLPASTDEREEPDAESGAAGEPFFSGACGCAMAR